VETTALVPEHVVGRIEVEDIASFDGQGAVFESQVRRGPGDRRHAVAAVERVLDDPSSGSTGRPEDDDLHRLTVRPSGPTVGWRVPVRRPSAFHMENPP